MENIKEKYNEYRQFVFDHQDRVDIGKERVSIVQNNFGYFMAWYSLGEVAYFMN
jgi:hypothetical protein